MFECIYSDNELKQEEKSNKLLIISEGMYKDSIVIDKEINWFSTCIKLY